MSQRQSLAQKIMPNLDGIFRPNMAVCLQQAHQHWLDSNVSLG
jgi:hypothetical protein